MEFIQCAWYCVVVVIVLLNYSLLNIVFLVLGLFYILVYMLFSLAMGREWLILELHSLGLKLNWLLAPQVTMSHSRGLLPEGPRTPRLSSLDVFCSVL